MYMILINHPVLNKLMSILRNLAKIKEINNNKGNMNFLYMFSYFHKVMHNYRGFLPSRKILTNKDLRSIVSQSLTFLALLVASKVST